MSDTAHSYLQKHSTRIGAALVGMVLAGALSLAVFSPIGRHFTGMGIVHILSGYDHLAFLAMLMIATRNLKDLLWIATTFTVAHSVTLTAAGLGWIAPTAAWVEPAIALTLLYVALENLIAATPKARLLLIFGFGLIHGLGFAGALSEGPLPPAAEILALLSFNLGVEIGQIAFLALVYPPWRALARTSHARRARQVLALGVIGLCLYWLLQRLS